MSDCFKGSHPVSEDLSNHILVSRVVVLKHLSFILFCFGFLFSDSCFLFTMGLFFFPENPKVLQSYDPKCAKSQGHAVRFEDADVDSRREKG